MKFSEFLIPSLQLIMYAYISFIHLLCLFVAGINAAATVTEIYPDFWMITNHPGGLTDHDYFSVFTYEFPYMGITINDIHLNKYKTFDREHYNLAEQQLYRTADYDEVHMMSWQFPRGMPQGPHELAIFGSQKPDPEWRQGVWLLVTMHCESVPIALLPESRYPRLCTLDKETSRLREPID